MNIAYSASFSLNGEVLIKKGSSAGNGNIPNTIPVRSISLWPDKVADAFPTYYVKGINENSNWVKIDPSMPIFSLDGMSDDVSDFFYVYSGSAITINIIAKGKN